MILYNSRSSTSPASDGNDLEMHDDKDDEEFILVAEKESEFYCQDTRLFTSIMP